MNTEIIDGVVVVRILGSELLGDPDRYASLRALLISRYAEAAYDAVAASCIVVFSSDAAFYGAALFRALMGLWNLVTDKDARLAVVGYPRVLEDGTPATIPPLLPNFALAQDLACALTWIKQSQNDLAGGDHWPSISGVSYGRSFLPGEKVFGEWDAFATES